MPVVFVTVAIPTVPDLWRALPIKPDQNLKRLLEPGLCGAPNLEY